MSKVELANFFRDDFLHIVNSHKNRIQKILNEYDIAIFMARKAICFFDALVENEEVKLTKCRVLSSRVVDYDGLKRFRGKKIAIIDDVVVKGTSIKKVAEKLACYNVSADYFVIACEESFSRGLKQQDIELKKPYTYYLQSDIYKLSGLITQYIEATMRTFNVDSPIYDITCNSTDIKRLLHENGFIDLTSGLQKKYGVTTHDLYFSFDKGKENKSIENVLINSIIKIRFYNNSKKILAVPFVLLPKCSIYTLDLLYSWVKQDAIDELVKCDNGNVQNENKFKIVSYIFTMAFFCSFACKYNISYRNLEYYDIIQFDMPIGSIIDDKKFKALCDLFNNVEICNIEFSKFEFTHFIKYAYQFISSINLEYQPYTNWEGKKISKNIETGTYTLNNIVFSVNDLYNGIKNNQTNVNQVYISSVVDVFIDKGLIVPSIVHEGNNILRAYKMGEFSKLTGEQLYSFVKMIFWYQTNTDHNLDKTEFEKLCVLYFRAQINNHCFGEITEYDEGSYGIGYSFYGPRMSSSNELYNVPNDAALVTDFIEKDIVRVSNDGKYFVSNEPAIQDRNLEYSSITFAADYSELYKCFHQNKTSYIFNDCISTYDQYLTVLAIGENLKNQILSLCAEIYQIRFLNKDLFLKGNDNNNLNRHIIKVLSGIDSGMWKYRCYKENALDRATNKIKDIQPQALRAVINVNTAYDRGDETVKLRDEFGIFLYKTAYIINELLHVNGNKKSFDNLLSYAKLVDKDNETIFTKSNLNYYEDLRNNIISEIGKTVKAIGAEKTIDKYVDEILNESYYMLDKCDLFLETNSACCKEVNEFIVIFSASGSLPINYANSKACIISGLNSSPKIAVFSILSECERAVVFDNLMCDTQDVEDCIYLYVTSLTNDFEGYVQFDDVAKGKNSVRFIKRILKYIDKLPVKKQHLFVLRHSENEADLELFIETKIFRQQISVLNYDNYTLDLYSIERKKTMEKISNITNININDDNKNVQIAIGRNIQQTINNNGLKEEISTIIQEVLEASNELTSKEQEEVKEYTDVIKEEINSDSPKRSMIKTAVDGLKRFITSQKFIDAVSKLTPLVIGFIEKMK